MAGPVTFRRGLAVLLAAAALAGCAAVVSACGSDDAQGNDRDATALLQRAFSKSIPTAKVKLSAQLKVEGLQGFDKPITLDATGPYESAKTTLPKLDLDVTIGAAGQGQSLQTGFLSTGDRAFLKFGGVYYEQSKASVARANRQVAGDRGRKRQGPLGLSPAKWVRGAQMEGSEKIGGVDSDHVTATLDVRTMLEQLNTLARRGANAVGGATTPEPLTTQQLDQAAEAVKDPRFDIYVGKSDGLVHRVSGALSLSLPKSARTQTNGIRGGSLRFTIDLTDTGRKQEIEAPSTSRPISELSKQLGGAAALGGLGGGQGTDTTPDNGTTTPGGTSTTPGGTSTAPDADAFQRYSQCLDRAKPGDTGAITRCRSELGQ